MKPKQLDFFLKLAWQAGFIDGEGYLESSYWNTVRRLNTKGTYSRSLKGGDA